MPRVTVGAFRMMPAVVVMLYPPATPVDMNLMRPGWCNYLRRKLLIDSFPPRTSWPSAN